MLKVLITIITLAVPSLVIAQEQNSDNSVTRVEVSFWQTEALIAQAETVLAEKMLLEQLAELCKTADSDLCSADAHLETNNLFNTQFKESLIRKANIERWIAARNTSFD